MKNSIKTLFLTIIFLSLSPSFFAQDMYDKLSKELCECIEKENIKRATEMDACFENLLVTHLIEIKEYYNASTISEIDIEEFGGKIGAHLIKQCDYVLDNFPNGITRNDEKVTKQIDLTCKDLKQGDYYYLTQIPNSTRLDTTFVTISNSMYLERMKNGRTYSLLEIIWKDACSFDLKFKESNDPIKKQLSKLGDIYQYEILVNEENSFFLKTFWRQREYQFELFKIK